MMRSRGRLFMMALAASAAVQGHALFGQIRSQAAAEQNASQALVHPSSGGLSSLFGLLDPSSFRMRHTLSYNYASAGGAALSTASYTNSMFYRIAPPLDIRFDVTLQGSPFGPTAGYERNAFNRVFLSRAELNYRPFENLIIQVQYRDLPYGSWGNYGLYDSPFYRFGDY
jgi:hypothetical protein